MSSKEVTVKRNIPSAGLMIAVGACILYYLLVYIPANESRIKLRSVRQLNSFVENCAGAYEGYDEGVKASNGKQSLMDPNLKTTKDSNNWSDPTKNGIAISDDDSTCVLLTWRDATKDTMRYMVTVEHLVHPLEDFREFDDIIITDAHDTVGGDVLDKSRLRLSYYPVHDSLLNSGVYIQEVKNLSSETYYAFYKRVKLGRSKVAVIAFLSKTTFDKRARQVAPSMIIFFMLGFLMLLLSWPMLKLLLVNEHERLQNSDVQMANYAVIFVAAFLTISITGGYFFLASGPSQIDNVLQTLSSSIKKNYWIEVDSRDSVLKTDNLFPTDSFFCKRRIVFYNNIGYNEIFSATANGMIDRLLVEDTVKRYDKSFGDDSIRISVKTRPYFSEMKRLQDLKEHSRIFVQSMKSRTTGVQECAISRIHKGEIRVITSRLLSVMNPILPPNYGFAIFDHDGMVQFHSDTRKVINENFLEECGRDAKLRSYMDNGTSESIRLHYGYDDYQMYFTPLSREWFLVTFYNRQHIGNLGSSVISFSLVSYAAILVYIVLLHLFFRHDRPNFKVLRSRTFFYQWLNPTLISSRKLHFVIKFLAVIVIIDLVWFIFGSSIVSSFLMILLTVTIFYSVIYRLLRNPETTSRFEIICFSLIGLWAILFVINEDNYRAFIAVPLLGSYAYAYWKALRFKENETDIVESAGSYKLYRSFLMVSLLVLAIIPSSIFFKDHLEHEKIIRTRKSAIMQHAILNPPTIADDISLLKGLPYVYYNRAFIGQAFDNAGPGPYFRASDTWFYDRTINYFGDDEVAHRGLVAPDSGSWELGHNKTHVFVRDHKRKPGRLDPWTSLPLSQFPFTAEARRRMPLFIIMVVLAMWALWRVSFEVIRRVFYLPLFCHSYVSPKSRLKSKVDDNYFGVVNPMTQDVEVVPFSKYTEGMSEFDSVVKDYESKNNMQIDDANDLGSGYSLRTAIFEHNTLSIKQAFKDHFESAWAALSDDEKYFLYDLAEDGIVNQYDKKMMNRMCEQGFIRLIPLEISHPAVAEYVVEATDRDSIAKMERKARTEGRWSSFRLPLAIVIIASLGFLSIVEEGLFSKISALLASVAFILPTLLNVFSSLPKLLPGKE
jgi:hypothetical protein